MYKISNHRLSLYWTLSAAQLYIWCGFLSVCFQDLHLPWCPLFHYESRVESPRVDCFGVWIKQSGLHQVLDEPQKNQNCLACPFRVPNWIQCCQSRPKDQCFFWVAGSTWQSKYCFLSVQRFCSAGFCILQMMGSEGRSVQLCLVSKQVSFAS